MDIPPVLTKQIGPLPVYAWAGIGVVGIIVARKLSGGPSATPQVLGQIVDGAEPGTGGAGGDGVSHVPVGTGGTGSPGGNGKSYTVVKITSKTPFYTPGALTRIAGYLTPKSTSGSYIVQKVTLSGKSFYKITGKISSAGIIDRNIPAVGHLIPFHSPATTYKVSTTTPTQAAA